MANNNSINGELFDIKSIICVAIPKNFTGNASSLIDQVSTENGFLNPQFGLLTTIPINCLCIVKYDYITTFVIAGISDSNCSINIIVTSTRPLYDLELLNYTKTVTELKDKVLSEMKIQNTITSSYGVIVSCEKSLSNPEMLVDTITSTGERISKAVKKALTEALNRYDALITSTTKGVTRVCSKVSIQQWDRPSYYIYVRSGDEYKWHEWIPEGCLDYPCHNCVNQQCNFCYCPLYPCMDSDFGKMINTSSGVVWSCMDCTLVHIPEVSEYLLNNPEASINELKRFAKNKKLL